MLILINGRANRQRAFCGPAPAIRVCRRAAIKVAVIEPRSCCELSVNDDQAYRRQLHYACHAQLAHDRVEMNRRQAECVAETFLRQRKVEDNSRSSPIFRARTVVAAIEQDEHQQPRRWIADR